jgi:hypothetical protein
VHDGEFTFLVADLNHVNAAQERAHLTGFLDSGAVRASISGTATAVPWLLSPSAAQASFMQYTAGS